MGEQRRIKERTLVHSFFVFLSILVVQCPLAALQTMLRLEIQATSTTSATTSLHLCLWYVLHPSFFSPKRRDYSLLLSLSLSRMRIFVVRFGYIVVVANDKGAW
jgi:hypothetical protein